MMPMTALRAFRRILMSQCVAEAVDCPELLEYFVRDSRQSQAR